MSIISEDNDNVGIHNQLQFLFDEIRSQRDEMKTLKEVQGKSFSVTNEVKSLRSVKEKEIKWTHIGKIQFVFNSGLEDINNHIQWALEHSKIDYAKELVQEVADKLKKKRNN